MIGRTPSTRCRARAASLKRALSARRSASDTGSAVAGSAKQRANRVAFGNKFGKSKSKADTQIKRETKRIAAYRNPK